MKKSAAVLLALLFTFTFSFPCQATENEEATTEHPETTEYPDEPGREPDLVSGAAIVMDAATGQILFEKNAEERKYPASITKIMTALVALDHNIDFNDTITMSENAVWGIDRLSTHLALDVGEKITVQDCIYGTMVRSANECAYALAEYVAGDVESFAKMMNDKAAELGCKNTHFVTPNGLHEDDHYTCAYDMALITQAAMQYDAFREITGSENYTIPETNMQDETRFFWNGNKMIIPSEPYYYEYCEGGKNGYTSMANNTLSTYAKKDGLELICVVLDCDGQSYTYSDSRALYNFCYNNYAYFYPLSDFSFEAVNEDISQENALLTNYYTNLDHEMVDLTVDRNYSLLVSSSMDTTQIKHDIKLYDKAKDNILGEINFTYDGEQIGTTAISSTTPLFSSHMTKEEEEPPKPSRWKTIGKIALYILIVVVALVIVFLLYTLISSSVRKIKRHHRRRRYRRRKRDDDYFF